MIHYKSEGHFNYFGLVAVGSPFNFYLHMLKELSLSLISGETTNEKETVFVKILL